MDEKTLFRMSVLLVVLGTLALGFAAVTLPARELTDAGSGERVTLKGDILNVRSTEKTTQITLRTTCTLKATVFDKANLTRGPVTAKGSLEGTWPTLTIDEIKSTKS